MPKLNTIVIIICVFLFLGELVVELYLLMNPASLHLRALMMICVMTVPVLCFGLGVAYAQHAEGSEKRVKNMLSQSAD